MQVWSVRVDATGAGPLSEDDADAIVEALSDYGPAIGVDPNRLSIRFTIEAATLHEGVLQGLALIKRNLPALAIQHIEAQTVEELNRELETDDTEYVGLAETARMFGVSKQRVSALAKTAEFPRPVGRLASGSVWTLSSIAHFLRNWDRRPGRRKDHQRGAAAVREPV